MRKNNNKKGFTIVELVIVIAVIGILAAVMIPTFAGVISDANEKAALQEAQNKYKELYAEDLADGLVDGAVDGTAMSNATGTDSDYSYSYTPVDEDEEEDPEVIFTYTTNGYTVTYNGTKWVATPTTGTTTPDNENEPA